MNKRKRAKSHARNKKNFFLMSRILTVLAVEKKNMSMRHQSARIFGSKQIGKVALALSLPLGVFMTVLFSSVAAMQKMHDSELANVTGQALMQMDKSFRPAGNRTIDGQSVTWKDTTFYKAGLDAVLELNLNIDKLQLGCGGINGPGCDIDIDQLSLSGQCLTDRPGCSASLTRPFFEFAINNDDKKTLREVVGIRMSAENASGMLTAGQNTSSPNGINVLSGYMRTTKITGIAQTEAVEFAGPNDPCRNNPASCGVSSYNGNLSIRAILSLLGSADLTAVTQGGRGNGIDLPSLNVGFESDDDGALVYGNRVTSTSVQVTGTVPTISFPNTTLIGRVTSCTGGIACPFVPSGDIDVNTSGGGMTGLGLVSNFTQDLGLIHRINVDSPFSLSFQKDSIWWPDANQENVALPGWWMAFDDAVDLGHLEPAQQVDISPAFPQLVGVVENYFQNQPLNLDAGNGWTALTGGYMNVTMPMMNVSGTNVSLDLTDLPLADATQSVPSNCWGGAATFC